MFAADSNCGVKFTGTAEKSGAGMGAFLAAWKYCEYWNNSTWQHARFCAAGLQWREAQQDAGRSFASWLKQSSGFTKIRTAASANKIGFAAIKLQGRTGVGLCPVH